MSIIITDDPNQNQDAPNEGNESPSSEQPSGSPSELPPPEVIPSNWKHFEERSEAPSQETSKGSPPSDLETSERD